jgi:hypothetical protein
MKAWLETRRVMVWVLALGLFAMATRAATDPDLGWHLRTGQLTIQNHCVFHTDPYSFTRSGQPWVNHEWLSEVLMFSVYRVAGCGGLVVLFAGIISAAFMLVFRRCSGRPYGAAIFVVWAATASVPLWGVRPQMISLLLGSLFLFLLERSAAQPALVWWTVPLMLLWVNLHAGYALGVVFIFLYLAGVIAEGWFSRESPTCWVRAKRLALAMVLALAMIPFNPNGLRIFGYPLETLRSPTMQSFINEWSSPNFHDAKYFPFMLMLAMLPVLLSFSRASLKPHQILLLLSTAGAALFSVRHIPIFVIVAAPILSLKAQDWFRHRPKAITRPTAKSALNPIWLNRLILAALIVFVLVRVRSIVEGQPRTEAQSFPAGAVSFLLSHHASQPILNHYNWGGYFIWKLYPQYLVYIDGRADLYGDSFLKDFASTYYFGDGWDQILEKWKIRTVILPPDAPLVTGLQGNPRWKPIYSDSQAIIVSRVSSQ